MKLSEIIAKISNETIYSQTFKEFARKLPKYFRRDRKMPFEDLMIFMLFHLKCSIPTALRRYFKTKNEAIVEQRTEKWHGYRLYANDGSKIALPDDKKLLWLMV